jgi:hypothetical protein
MSEMAAYLGELGVVTNKDVIENSSSLDLYVRQTGFARVGWVHRDKRGACRPIQKDAKNMLSLATEIASHLASYF